MRIHTKMSYIRIFPYNNKHSVGQTRVDSAFFSSFSSRSMHHFSTGSLTTLRRMHNNNLSHVSSQLRNREKRRFPENPTPRDRSNNTAPTT